MALKPVHCGIIWGRPWSSSGRQPVEMMISKYNIVGRKSLGSCFNRPVCLLNNMSSILLVYTIFVFFKCFCDIAND